MIDIKEIKEISISEAFTTQKVSGKSIYFYLEYVDSDNIGQIEFSVQQILASNVSQLEKTHIAFAFVYEDRETFWPRLRLKA